MLMQVQVIKIRTMKKCKNNSLLLQLFFITTLITVFNTCQSIPTALKNFARTTRASTALMGGSIAAAIAYGVLNDQITARVCPEYFTHGFHKSMMDRWHTPLMRKARNVILNSNSPTKIGLIWGTIATWWMGALIGVPITLAAQAGRWPKLYAKDLVKPTAIGLGALGTCTITTCFGVLALIKLGKVNVIKGKRNSQDWYEINAPGFRCYLPASVAQGVPEEKMAGWIADAAAHQVAYIGGACLGISLIGRIVHKRYKMNHRQNGNII